MYSIHQNNTSKEGIKNTGSNSATKANVGYPSRTIVHAKLETTSPGDMDEVEADAVANDVVSGKIARKVSGGTAGGGVAVSSAMESQLGSMQGKGRQMPDGLRNMMESGFDRDFSQVRLHTGSDAAEMSNSIHAKAFTHGNDIYFNQGQYAPETTEGQHLIAHELTHVVQNNGKVARETINLSLLTDEERKERMEISEARATLKYCSLRAESLIESIQEQEKLDHSFWGITSNLFGGESDWDSDYMISTSFDIQKLADMTIAKIDSKDCNLIAAKALAENLKNMVWFVHGALAAHRNASIEGAEDCITALKITKTVCFTIAGTIATGGMGFWGTVGINAGISGVDALISEGSKAGFGVSGGVKDAGIEVVKSTATGALGGFLGAGLGAGFELAGNALPSLPKLASGVAVSSQGGSLALNSTIGLISGEYSGLGRAEVEWLAGNELIPDTITGNATQQIIENDYESDTDINKVKQENLREKYSELFNEKDYPRYQESTRKEYLELFKKREDPKFRFWYNKETNTFYADERWMNGTTEYKEHHDTVDKLNKIVKEFPFLAPKRSLNPYEPYND